MEQSRNNMSLACESEVRAQNECALRFSISSKPIPLLEYIKAISSLIGASHILAVFEESESLKVFFDDKRYVDSLIRSGIHVMGHHVRVDYVTPPGVKIILTNLDPVVTNYDVMRVLSAYGAVVSPIIRPPISDDIELCHIGYGVRYAYMILTGGIPNKIDFKSGDQIYSVKTRVEDRSGLFMIPYIKTDEPEENFLESVSHYECLPGPSGINTNAIECSDPVVVSVESTASESSSVQIESSRSLNDVTTDRRKVGRPRKNMIMKRKKVTSASQAAKRIKTKRRFMTARMFKYYNRGRGQLKPHTKNRDKQEKNCNETTVDLPLTPISSDNTDSINNDQINYENVRRTSLSGKCILDMPKLITFVEEVKHHRAPLELAKKFIGESWNDNALNILIEQLYEYKLSQNDTPLKTRVWRLIKSLKESM